jgi:hypothetical protein
MRLVGRALSAPDAGRAVLCNVPAPANAALAVGAHQWGRPHSLAAMPATRQPADLSLMLPGVGSRTISAAVWGLSDSEVSAPQPPVGTGRPRNPTLFSQDCRCPRAGHQHCVHARLVR